LVLASALLPELLNLTYSCSCRPAEPLCFNISSSAKPLRFHCNVSLAFKRTATATLAALSTKAARRQPLPFTIYGERLPLYRSKRYVIAPRVSPAQRCYSMHVPCGTTCRRDYVIQPLSVLFTYTSPDKVYCHTLHQIPAHDINHSNQYYPYLWHFLPCFDYQLDISKADKFKGPDSTVHTMILVYKRHEMRTPTWTN
jgi:hypothetical protein